MMSGHATIDTAVEATRIGALNFLEKPISLQKLLKAVQQGISRGQEVTRVATIPTRTPLASADMHSHHLSADKNLSPAVGITYQTTIPVSLVSADTQFFTASFELPLREARDAFERAYFEHHLGREGGSMTRVAEKTGLERTHLYRKLKQLGVEPGKIAKKGI